ncbi:Hsp20 family protein [Ferrovibrio sp. MS7]|jgi:molecular chaperone IbpA|uniref:Hsp20 family protein n=1 Tax=Ferrovibrio TaxID=1231242 RepID=UPI001B6AB24B|nr:Hsp20 family protein [Ferrovibrio sp.]
MRAFDISPLLRSSVGFDHVNRLFDLASRLDESSLSYPPYNIEKRGEDAYRITMAVAGFRQDELDVTVKENSLTISAKAQGAEQPEEGVTYLHRGIARRAFERRFELADTVKVVGAQLTDGLLHIELKREIPEAKKPRQISINVGSQPVTLEQARAA